MLPFMRVRLGLLVATSALLLSACSGTDDPTFDTQATSASASELPSATASPYPYTDCDALRPGDPLSTTAIVCRAGSDGDGRLGTTDCTTGTYAYLDRTQGQDLEGIVRPGATWRAASPIDPRYGRTLWAFENCLEGG